MYPTKEPVKKNRKAAYILIINGEAVYVVIKARGPFTGKIDLIGGGLEDNESYFTGLIREIKEETQLPVKNKERITFLGNFSYNVIHSWKGVLYDETCKAKVYIALTDTTLSNTQNDDDVRSISKIPYADLIEKDLGPILKQIVEKYTLSQLYSILIDANE